MPRTCLFIQRMFGADATQTAANGNKNKKRRRAKKICNGMRDHSAKPNPRCAMTDDVFVHKERLAIDQMPFDKQT